VGLPDDIGPAIAALLSDANRWVNAQADRNLRRHDVMTEA